MIMDHILLDSLTVSFGWCLTCIIIHLGWGFFSGSLIPGFSEIESKKQKKAWYNRGVSTVHACVMFSMTAYYWLYINPTVQISSAGHKIEAFALDIMMGYLYYDILYELMTSRQPDALSHHILGVISHLSSRLSNNKAAAFYSMLVYIAEGSTPFLNISWLLYLLQLKKTNGFKICAAILILSFFCCRILLGPYMVYHMLYHREEWGIDGRGALYIGNTTIVSIFAVLNFYWFYKLLIVAIGSAPAPHTGNTGEKIMKKTR